VHVSPRYAGPSWPCSATDEALGHPERIDLVDIGAGQGGAGQVLGAAQQLPAATGPMARGLLFRNG
jgi:hypothetical protein